MSQPRRSTLPLFSRSMSTRFLTIAMGLALLIGLLLGSIASLSIYRERLADLENAAHLQADVLTEVARQPLLDNDLSTLAALVASSPAAGHVLGIAVRDLNGMLLATHLDANQPQVAAQVAPVGNDPAARITALRSAPDVGHVTRTVVAHGTGIGRIELLYSLRPARNTALRMAGLAAVGSLLFSTLLAVMTTVIFNRKVRQPLYELEQLVRLLADGNLARRAPSEREDEIGALQRAFNRMADRLQETLHGLNDANRSAATANQALTEQRDFAMQVLDAMGQGLTVTDPEGYFVYANRAFGRIIGRDPQEIIGVTPYAFTVAEDNPLLRSAMDDRYAGRKSDYETRLLRSDQTIANVMVTGVPQIRDGRLVGTIAVITDLTERKQAEEALRRSEAEARKLSAVASRTDNMVIITDRHSRIEWVNAAFTRITGWELDEVLGRSPGDLLQGPETDPATIAFMVQRLANQQGFKCEMINYTKARQPYWVSVEVQPVVDDSGAVINYVAIENDITERRQIEQTLRQAKELAEEADRAKTEFLANMSHEIRTPMNAIIGLSSLLLHSNLTPIQRDYVETIRSSGDGLLEIINEILDFSKIEAGRLDLIEAPFDLHRCIEEALDLFSVQAGRKGIDLAYFVEPDVPPYVIGDMTRLRQVLVNLVSNAIKFTDQGEVVVLAHGELQTNGRLRLHFNVRDSGVGIPTERVGLLFKPFSQIDATATRRHSGTGLGLAICRRLVELMGGAIDYVAIDGPGALFRFDVLVRTTVTDGGEQLSPHPQVAGRRILIVDDNAAHGTIVARHLAVWDVVAEQVQTAAQALAQLSQPAVVYDAAIVDQQLRNADGTAMADLIQRRVAERGVPLIWLGAAGLQEPADAGAAAYLTRPLKPSLLYDTLVELFTDRRRPALPRLPRVPFDTTLGERHPLRILLAEDNMVNQKVALRILERLGYRADSVANGLEVLAALERQPYDVILMDVQMPELDGVSTTTAIHVRYGEQRPRIIALTAHALEGDREQYLAIGMDDYLSKPLRVETLIDALRRVPTPPVPVTTDAPSAPIDSAALQRRYGADAAHLLTELLPLFLQEALPLLATCRQALANGDAMLLARSAHAVKGAALSIAAQQVALLALQLEDAGSRGDLAPAARLLTELAAALDAVEAYQAAAVAG